MALPLGLSDALLDGFVGHFYRETDAVRDLLLIDEKVSFGSKPPPFSLPQIVVVGQESSGKSSVLESLAMLPLFPRDKRICTRMPIHLKMRRQQPAQSAAREVSAEPAVPTIKMRLVFADGRPAIESQQQFAPEQVAPLMKQWMDDIIQRESQDKGVSTGVVDHVLEIHVASPLVPTLDLVDLPGIVAGRLANEPQDMMEQTRALVEKYLKMPHTLVLAVVPAGERVRNSQAFQLVQKYGLVDRTIGVLTMADRAGDATDPRGAYAELMDKLDGHSDDLVALEPHGYVAVKNRDTRLDESQQLPLATFKAQELQWFKNNLSGYVDRGLASSGALAVKIERMLVRHVKDKWVPRTVEQLEDILQDSKGFLQDMGDGAQKVTQDFLALDEDGQAQFLLKLFDEHFTVTLVDCVDGLVVALARTLLKKIEVRRDADRHQRSLLRGMQTKSLVEKMIQRDESSKLLREFVPRAISSAFLRLSLLVTELLPLVSANYDEVERFENLHLLLASSLWDKAQEMLLDGQSLADRMVQAMDTDLVPHGAPLAPAFDCDEMIDIDPVVDKIISMLYTEDKVCDTVPLPLEDYFVPVVASVSAKANLSKAKPSEFGKSRDPAAVSRSLFFGLSASEIRNAVAHAATCKEVECISDQCAEILRLDRHSRASPVEANCTDCNLFRAITRHHVHMCKLWLLPPGMNDCIVCSWHRRVTLPPTAAGRPEPSSGEEPTRSCFTIGAPPDMLDDKPQSGRRGSLKPAETSAKSPKLPQNAPTKKPTVNRTDGKPRVQPRPWSVVRTPETGGTGPRFGRRNYHNTTRHNTAADTHEEELRRLVGVLSRFVVAPLVSQLLDVRAIRRTAAEYLKKYPLTQDDAPPTHWFADYFAENRQELLDEQRRLETALNGLRLFQ